MIDFDDHSSPIIQNSNQPFNQLLDFGVSKLNSGSMAVSNHAMDCLSLAAVQLSMTSFPGRAPINDGSDLLGLFDTIPILPAQQPNMPQTQPYKALIGGSGNLNNTGSREGTFYFISQLRFLIRMDSR